MTIEKALVTACNLSFLTGAKALLSSVKDLHPEVNRFCFGLPSECNALERELKSLATVVPMPKPLRGVPEKEQIAVAKIFTPLVPASIAAWYDCDCLMCRHSPEVWSIPEGKVNAVQDTAYEIENMVVHDLRESFFRQYPGIRHVKGLNGGFFCLRTEEWKDLPEQYERALEKGQYHRYPNGFDQPLLNALMLHKVNWLTFKFDAHHGFDYRVPRDVRVVHFSNMPKPWMPAYPRHQPQYYYWARYGERETNLFKLCLIKWKIILRTPRRLLMRWVKSRP